MTCVRSLFVTVHLASPGAGIDVTLELRGAGEGDRGSQKTSLLLCTCLSPPFSPRLHADLCRLPLGSANLDQVPPRTPFCFLAPVECEEAQGARSGVPRTSWLSPGMHYSICGELHFDFLQLPALWLFLLSLVVFKAVAEGLPESLALSGFSILLGTFLCAFWGQRRVTR